jgi:hypothetical protein
MEITTHPPQLTEKTINNWLIKFIPKVKRTTTRNAKDRLLLSVERMEPCNVHFQKSWSKTRFKNGRGKAFYPLQELVKNLVTFDGTRLYEDKYVPAEWKISRFQQKLLVDNPDLYDVDIERSDLQAENGQWCCVGDLSDKIISTGGEAVVFKESVEEFEIAARVQVFDPTVFTENGSLESYKYIVHLSKGK